MEVKEIKKLRKRMGLSLENFGKAVGVSWHTIYMWEHEKMQPSQLARRGLEMVRSQFEADNKSKKKGRERK